MEFTTKKGFFDNNIKMDNLESLRTIVPVLLEKDLYNPVIVCPSDTGVFRAKKLKYLFEQEGLMSKIAFITTRTLDKQNTLEFQGESHHYEIGTAGTFDSKNKYYNTR